MCPLLLKKTSFNQSCLQAATNILICHTDKNRTQVMLVALFKTADATAQCPCNNFLSAAVIFSLSGTCVS